MYGKMTKTKGVAILLASLMAVSMFCIVVSDDSEASVTAATKDAAGNNLDETYDYSRIITVGVGTLRWVSYFGQEDKVVCIDAGDANAASWNGKAYRSLFNFNQAELIKKMSGSTCHPFEADLASFGMACHDHAGFSTSNLEDIKGWSNKPTVMIVCKSVYDGFTPEHISGIKTLMKIVVIEEVDSFLNGDYSLSSGFQNNLSILAKVFNDAARAEKLSKSISDIVKDIQGLIDDETCKFSKAYVGGASQSGSKALTWSVGNYLPFQVAGVTNAYTKDSTTVATDGGSEIMSSATPSVIFIDLSTVKKISDPGSVDVLTYAQYNNTPIYTLLPYFWFGYNFDNALADAYFIVSVCYDGVLSAEKCIEKIESVYEAFYPNMADGSKALDGFKTYYSANGSKLIFEDQAYNYNGTEFVKIDRPTGDVENPDNEDDSNDMIIIGAVAVVLVVIVAGAFVLMRKR